jgi:hypothetical protein
MANKIQRRITRRIEMYTDTNYKTKKALKEAVAAGKSIGVFSPGMFPAPRNGKVTLEGPHGYHKWYAQATVVDGIITKVK